MRASTVHPIRHHRLNIFSRLTRREWLIFGVLAAAVLWGLAGGAAEFAWRTGREDSSPGDLYAELRAALPDPDFIPAGRADGSGKPGPPRRWVYLTRPPYPGEAEVETSEDGWIFFPRDYYTTININRAGLDELVALPGIGPVTAWRIINYRKRYSGFGRIKALKRIKGIGDRTLSRLEGKIRLY